MPEIVPNSIVCCDVIDGLYQIAEDSVHLIVTSPPFNVGIKYDKHNDLMSHDVYLQWMKHVWQACKRVLVTGGRLCINIDATMNVNDRQEYPERVHPLHVDFTNHLRELGYLYRGEINWFKQNSPGKDTCWGSYMLCSNPHIRRNSEYIILASKDDLTLQGDNMRCDLTKEEFHEWTLSEWKIKPETSKPFHPASFPRELAKRCIKLFSYAGNIVLDPFCGSGTTTSTALELGRRYIGIDNSERYCKLARSTISNIETEQKFAPYEFTPSPVIQKEHKINKDKKKNKADIFS
jgi:DNA modification methylase